jgi:hypothetical protein
MKQKGSVNLELTEEEYERAYAALMDAGLDDIASKLKLAWGTNESQRQGIGEAERGTALGE